MSRITKIPPSCRPNPEDWKKSVATATLQMLDFMRDNRPLAGSVAWRASVMGDLRDALATDKSASDFAYRLYEDRYVALAEKFRECLDGNGIGWRSPVTAESVMAVAQAVLDDAFAVMTEHRHHADTTPNPATGRFWTWRERLDSTIRMVIASERRGRNAGNPDGVRSQVRADLEEAMGPTSSSKWVKPRKSGRRDGRVTDETVVKTPYLIRLLLDQVDRDWYEPQNRAEVEEAVEAILTAELG